MRIPHNINKNTFAVYDPSKETLQLTNESGRALRSEDFLWDNEHCPTLATYCVDSIRENFANNPILDELPCPERNYLLETLDVNLPLELILPLNIDECYWERRYKDVFGKLTTPKPTSYSWKNLYLERHMQNLVESAEPQHNDEDEMSDITKLLCPYIHRLLITQLQMWRLPLHWDEEDIPEVYPLDHINFEPILTELKNIEEFGVVYGMNKVGDTFSWNMFKLSILDCQRLGKSINVLKGLKILRIHRSKLEDSHIRALSQGLVKNHTIEELDFSHCSIGNQGALCIAKVLTVHPVLRILNLCNNRIGGIGTEGIAFALLQPGSSPLEVLNIKLNPLKEDGAMGIMRCIVRNDKIKELSMAACQLEDDAPMKVGQMLMLNTSLKKLDVSNNWFDEEGGESLIHGLLTNKTLEWLDVRETDITLEQATRIKRLLLRNRLGLDDEEDSVEELEEEEEVHEEEVVVEEEQHEEND